MNPKLDPEQIKRAKAQAEQAAKAKMTSAYTLLRDIKPNLQANEIVKGLIPRGGFGEVHAVAGGGKTAIVVDLMLHVAAGMEYRGRRVERQPVVYCALEGHAGIGNRILAAAREIGVDDAPFALVKAADNFRDPAAAEKVANIARELLASFGGISPVIIIDTYAAALGTGGSDCEPRDVSAFIEVIKSQLLMIGCTVLVLHHFGKDASRGGRGWSGLNAALDFELEIARDDDLRTMRVTKSRDGSDSAPALCFRLQGRQLGTNEHGEPVTAVVVEHLADEDIARPGRKLSPKARAALNVLWGMIKDPSRSFPLPEQSGLRCVLVKDWEAACIEPGAISAGNRNADRRRQFRAAMDELIECEAITLDRERVYPTPKRESVNPGESSRNSRGVSVCEVNPPYRGSHIHTRSPSESHLENSAPGNGERASGDESDAPDAPDAGMPFMVTRAMRETLRARGFTDALINTLKPDQAHNLIRNDARPEHFKY